MTDKPWAWARERAKRLIRAEERALAAEALGREPLAEGREHLTVSGKFQSDRYPGTPVGKVPLSIKDTLAQDLLWEYARRHTAANKHGDSEFSRDLQDALTNAGFDAAEALRVAHEMQEKAVAAERERFVEMEARALSMFWLLPGDHTIGQLQGLADRARELQAADAKLARLKAPDEGMVEVVINVHFEVGDCPSYERAAAVIRAIAAYLETPPPPGEPTP